MDPKIEARLKPGTDYHPLQVIPFFRRWRPSVLRNLLFTAILCAIVIAVIVLFSLGMGHRITWKMLAEVATFSLLIGYTQHYLYKITITLARRRERLAPLLMHPLILGIALPVAAIYIGYVLAASLLTGTLWLNVSEN